MSADLIIEQLENANPVTADSGPSLDEAWSALQSNLDSSKRTWHFTRWLMRLGGTPVRKRRRFTVTVAFSLLVVLAIVVATTVTGSTGPHPNTTGPFSNVTWRLVSDQGPTQNFASTGGPQGLDEMTCATAQVCYLESIVTTGSSTSALVPISYVYRSNDGGSTWTAVPIPHGMTLDTPFSCFGPDSCMVGVQTGGTIYSAVGTIQEILTTTNGGTSWTVQQVPMAPMTGQDSALDSQLTGLQGSLTQLQCFNSESCIGFGTVPSVQPEQPLIAPLNGVSRTVVMTTQDGGKKWSSTVLPWSKTPTGAAAWSNEQELTATCSSQNVCVGIATVLAEGDSSGIQPTSMLEFRTANGGATWNSHWIPNVQGTVSALTCPDDNHCYATVEVGDLGAKSGTPEVLATSDGGATWRLENVFALTPSSGNGLTSITCPSIDTCLASGYQRSLTNAKLSTGSIFVTSDGGQTWSSSQLPPGLGIVTEVDCASAQTCLAIAQPPYLSGAPAPSGPMPSDILRSESAKLTSS
jgi:photosystem II stability/assembly factor-like uncharacterized protein